MGYEGERKQRRLARVFDQPLPGGVGGSWGSNVGITIQCGWGKRGTCVVAVHVNRAGAGTGSN